MKREHLVWMLSLGLLPAAAMGAGADTYAARCRSCHGAAGEGNATLARALKAEIRPLGSPEVQARKDDELKKIIAEGTGKMRPVAGLAAADVDAVVAHIRTFKAAK